MKRCTKCSFENSDSDHYCKNCGTKLSEDVNVKKYCNNCGAQINENAEFCDKCGTGISEGNAPEKGFNKKILIGLVLISICSVLFLTYQNFGKYYFMEQKADNYLKKGMYQNALILYYRILAQKYRYNVSQKRNSVEKKISDIELIENIRTDELPDADTYKLLVEYQKDITVSDEAEQKLSKLRHLITKETERIKTEEGTENALKFVSLYSDLDKDFTEYKTLIDQLTELKKKEEAKAKEEEAVKAKAEEAKAAVTQMYDDYYKALAVMFRENTTSVMSDHVVEDSPMWIDISYFAGLNPDEKPLNVPETYEIESIEFNDDSLSDGEITVKEYFKSYNPGGDMKDQRDRMRYVFMKDGTSYKIYSQKFLNNW